MVGLSIAGFYGGLPARPVVLEMPCRPPVCFGRAAADARGRAPAGFANNKYSGPGATEQRAGLSDFSEGAFPHIYNLYQAFVDVDCAAAHSATPWVCMLANYSHEFVSARAFIVESQTDQAVLEYHDCLPGNTSLWGPQVRLPIERRRFRSGWSISFTDREGTIPIRGDDSDQGTIPIRGDDSDQGGRFRSGGSISLRAARA